MTIDKIRNIHHSNSINNPKILSVANQKGGVGKTTTAINLATALVAVGQSVLVIDLDPQGNASTGLGVDRKLRKMSIYNVLLEPQVINNAIVNTEIKGLDLIPSAVHLTGAEIELIEIDQREYRLKKAMDLLEKKYDVVLVDCPPSLNLLTLNALVASNSVLVPLQCEFFALEGLSFLVKTLDRVQKRFNSRLVLEGVVLTMFDRRNNLSNMVYEDVKRVFGAKVYDAIIPRNVRVSEAPSHGKPVLIYDHRCRGSRAYIDLASEYLKKNQSHQQVKASVG